jgi:hypothetical protein
MISFTHAMHRIPGKIKLLNDVVVVELVSSVAEGCGFFMS